jgi:hypothetical protein
MRIKIAFGGGVCYHKLAEDNITIAQRVLKAPFEEQVA